MTVRETWAPARVNLIGEHIDYHGLDVLPIAIRRGIRVRFAVRPDRRIQARSLGPWGSRGFEWTRDLAPAAPGDWENYLRAAAKTVAERWGIGAGIDAEIESDVPPAAGLSSSSALFVAFTLALLAANGWRAEFADLMEILPEGERFVGTRGGAMDHAALLGSRTGYASRISFEPLRLQHIPVPPDWAFLVAHSLRTAEKSAGVREVYNARRLAGTTALGKLGLATYRDVRTAAALDGLAPEERASFLHVTSEARRVALAVEAMERGDAVRFGGLLLESHQSLRDGLRVLIDVCESTGKQKQLQDYLDRAALFGRDPRGGAMALLLAVEMAGLR
jgi:galactokinase